MGYDGFTPRQHQRHGLDICINALERRFIISACTGSGKNKLIQMVAQYYSNVLLITDRVSVVDQLMQERENFGLMYDIMTTQKAIRNVKLLGNYDIVLIDECHAMFTSVLKFIKDNDIKLIGFTATATRRALLIYYNKIYSIATFNNMVKDGYLVEPTFYSTQLIKTSDIDFTATGNLTTASSEKIDERITSVKGDLVIDYTTKEYGKSGIILAPSIKIAHILKDEFITNGISCVTYVSDNSMSDKEKKYNLDKFRDGEVKIIVSVDAIAKGFDAPIAEFIMDCRPRSFKHGFDGFVQANGRVLRIADGKTSARVYDYVGNCQKFMGRLAIHNEHGCNAIIDKDFKIHNCEACNGEYDTKPPTICRQCKDFSVQKIECIFCQHKNNVRALSCSKCKFSFEMTCPHCNLETSFLVSSCIHCKKSIEVKEQKERAIKLVVEQKELVRLELPSATNVWGLSEVESYKCFASTIKYKIEFEKKQYKSPAFYAYNLWQEFTKHEMHYSKFLKTYSEAKPKLYIDCVNFIQKKGKEWYARTKSSASVV